ncbi:MAG: hypothetical protein J6O90_03770 [Candidatus Methanomethylophilaceae archaeon]|nr:hypothetical protein [Candidatus Methanomethylophilaceae archaeon]
MKISEAYRLAIETGMKNDPRPKEEVDRVLKDAKEQYDKMDDDKKQYFDQERLWNPYADPRFSWGDGDRDVSTLMWGIDIGTGEVLLADRLNEKGRNIGGIVAHHPLGSARTPFPEVMSLQTEMYHAEGVPINVAESMMGPRMEEVIRAVLPANYNQAVDAARLLGIPIMNIHSPADNCVQKFLEDVFEKDPPKYLSDIIDRLMGIEEFQTSCKYNNGPKIVVGSPKNRCGKVAVKMTGGTSGPKEIYEALAAAGVGTVVAMHFPESHLEEARKHRINMIVSGHMASDSLGINLIADEWQKHGLEVLPCSGLIRVSRV